jgi:hypothetical protein
MTERSIEEYLKDYDHNLALAHVAKAIAKKGHVQRWDSEPDDPFDLQIVKDAEVAKLQWACSRKGNVMVLHRAMFDTMSDKLNLLEYWEYNPTTEKVDCLYSSGYE